MAIDTFHTYVFDPFGVVGADPFSGTANTNPAAVGSVITIDPNARWTLVSVDDDETMLDDNDPSPQHDLVSDVVLSGTTYTVGTHVETEYEYVVRLSSSSSPADNFAIHAITMDGVVVGVASTASMVAGESYMIVAEGSAGTVR